MRRTLPLLWALPALAILTLSATRFGPLPAIGPLLDPWAGIWSVARDADPSGERTEVIPSLAHPVETLADQRGVPHIFAATDLDAWRALGWLHARDRLFQLDLQTRAAQGTLSEWIGRAALPLDREMRVLGLAHLADSLWAALDSTAPARRALQAYADGVSARLASLGPGDLPFEYHLLGVQPRPWRPEYTFYLAMRMAYTLSWQDTDLEREAMATLVGDVAAAQLLPAESPLQEPVVPGAAAQARALPFRLPPPAAGSGPRRTPPTLATAAFNDLRPGSNNWAIAPRRTAQGHVLLAGDPHLELTLPSVWYEAHLVTADGMNVYGVTLPGEPAVLIGLTPGVAWSFTNSEGDFVDHYRETVDDDVQPTRHLVDGAWHPVTNHVEEFRGRGGHLLATDTMYRTRRGPLMRYAGEWRSVRWTALEVRDPLGSFLRLQRVRTVSDFLAAHGTLEAPAQNGVAVDTAGHIAELTAGRFPRRPNNDGGTIFDGSLGRNDWIGDLPAMPSVVDPARGTLYSANQQGLDPRVDPAYRGNGWAAPWRAIRIARLLASDSAVTLDAMRRWQTDPISERAEWWRGSLIAAASGIDSLRTARALLDGWHDGYRPGSRSAPLFETVMDAVASLAWDELVTPDGHRAASPSTTVLAALRDAPDDIWWDRRATQRREGRDDILRLALARGWAQLTAADRLGPDTTAWRWDRFRTARIPHLAFIPGLGEPALSVTGGNGTLSPLGSGGTHGPSWRMVVEMGPRPVAYTTYPGGQSGNPSSARYDDRVEQWRAGALDSARMPSTIEELDVADRAEQVHFVAGNPTPVGWHFSTWWLLPVIGLVWGAVAGRWGWSPWWALVFGGLVWGGVLAMTWVPGSSWRLATRAGGVFGGMSPIVLVLVVPFWGALLAGVVAKATKSVVGGR
ncbi:MAG: penicillin acylase family protein [Gemmatimonadota bacterium]